MVIIAGFIYLYFDALVDRVVLRFGLNRNAREDTRIGIWRGDFIYDAKSGIADLFAGIPEVVLGRVGDRNQQAVVDFKPWLLTGGSVLVARDPGPACEVASIK